MAPASTAGKAPASTASKAPAKPTEGSKVAGEGGEEKKKRRKLRKETYSSYIYKVLKQYCKLLKAHVLHRILYPQVHVNGVKIKIKIKIE
jgi:hypothetical protein